MTGRQSSCWERQLTIELCFGAGGRLSGVTEAGSQNSFLKKWHGSYEFEKDVICFGPGNAGHKVITNLEGERYSTCFSSLRTEGMHVYIVLGIAEMQEIEFHQLRQTVAKFIF